jgi:hypothetical protein
MQFTKPYKKAIVEGRLTKSIRAWKTPRVKVGGQYNIDPFGAIEVTALKQQPVMEISQRTLADAGHADQQSLLNLLKVNATTNVFIVTFRFLGATRVNQVGTTALATAELRSLLLRLSRMDGERPWAQRALQLIAEHPGVRAGDLAPHLKMDTATFKRQIRKLKGQGLTISLEAGYKLSPRGKQILKHLLNKTGNRG